MPDLISYFLIFLKKKMVLKNLIDSLYCNSNGYHCDLNIMDFILVYIYHRCDKDLMTCITGALVYMDLLFVLFIDWVCKHYISHCQHQFVRLEKLPKTNEPLFSFEHSVSYTTTESGFRIIKETSNSVLFP